MVCRHQTGGDCGGRGGGGGLGRGPDGDPERSVHGAEDEVVAVVWVVVVSARRGERGARPAQAPSRRLPLRITAKRSNGRLY
jgi:hypothetical protein